METLDFVQPRLLLRRELLFLFLLQPLDFLVFLVGQALVVDGNVFRFGRSFRFSDNTLQVVEFLNIDVIELEQFIIIQIAVVKAVADNLLCVGALQLLEQLGRAVLLHFRAGHGDHRAVIEKLPHKLLVAFFGFAGFRGHRHGAGHHFQCAVRGKVKDVCGLLDLAAFVTRRLHPEDGL